jgi:acetylornithine deacetylase/succinyl-diaminopimelate desuccinylase-like protein
MSRGRERIVIAAAVLAVAAAVGWLVVANRRAERELASQIYVPKPAVMTPEIVLLQQYVRIDTSNPPGNELPGAQWLAAQLAAAGVKSELIETAPRRVNLYARIKGKHPGEGLLLHNHIDVVPAPPTGWDVPPFSGAIRINMLHGRGAIDMKSIALCELEAFIDVARSGKTPERDLVFLATADEEEGSALGTRWLLEHRPDVFDGIRYAITEGGVTEMEQEKVTYFGVETGSKQLVTADFLAPDEATLRRARIALEPSFRPRDADRLLPGVRRFFHAVAPQRLESRETLEDIDATLAAGKFWLLPATMRELLQNSVWAQRVRRLPDGTFAMEVAMSNLPDEDPERRLQWLTAKAQTLGVRVGPVKRKDGPSPISPDDTPLFGLIAREVRRELGNIPLGPEVLAVSTNDARFLRPRGMICYGLQPFPLDFFQSLTVHRLNERVRLDWYMSGIRITKRLVAAYVFEPAAG